MEEQYPYRFSELITQQENGWVPAVWCQSADCFSDLNKASAAAYRTLVLAA
jgi:hypothetical protein